jgi:hypothetical protein
VENIWITHPVFHSSSIALPVAEKAVNRQSRHHVDDRSFFDPS